MSDDFVFYIPNNRRFSIIKEQCINPSLPLIGFGLSNNTAIKNTMLKFHMDVEKYHKLCKNANEK